MITFRKFIICFTLLSSFAYAQNSDVSVEFGLEFPTYFGMHTKISPYPNVYTRLGVGMVSNFMLGVPGVSAFMGSLSPDYGSEHIKFAFDAIDSALYGSLSIGYRMMEREGFYAEFGYSVIHKVGGSELPLSEMSSILNQSDLIAVSAENPMSKVNTTLHNGTLHAGYMLPLSSKVSLSTELGVIKPFLVSVGVQHGENSSEEQSRQSSKKIEKIMSQLWMVTGSLWLSFIF